MGAKSLRRSTLAAVLLLAGLAGYVYWFEREPVSDTKGEPVFGIDEKDVSKIEIRRKGEEPVVVEKTDESWRLVAPVSAEADATEVGLLTQNLATMRFERAVAKASEVQLSDFGLDQPRIEVRFLTGDGTERSLLFGSDTPTPRNQYARRGGDDDILVLASHLSLNFDKDAWALRDKQVFARGGTEGDVRRLELVRPTGRLVVEKESDAWHLSEPYRAKADNAAVTSLVSRLRAAEMREVVSERPEGLDAYGLKEPSRVARLEPAEGEPLVLEIGSEKGLDVYARNPARKPVFLLDKDLAQELDRAPVDFVSKKLFDFSALDVNRFRLEKRGEVAREYEKRHSGDETSWHRTTPEPETAALTKSIEDLLYALNGASASTIVEKPSDAKTGLDAPDFLVTVWSKDGSVEERVAISSREGKTIYARRYGDEVVLELRPESWKAIEAAWPLPPPKS